MRLRCSKTPPVYQGQILKILHCLQDELKALSITHGIICTLWGQELHGCDQTVLAGTCSMLQLWNCLKLVGKGHCWGWRLLPLLIQHHCRPLPEGSVLNSSLTLSVCSEVSPPLYFGFCDPATSAAPFQVCPGSILRKLLFPHMPQKPLDSRLASCASLPTVVQE